MMAFGQEWTDEEKLKVICADVSTLLDGRAWRQLEYLASMLVTVQKDKFANLPDFQSVRENAGVIDGIKKVLAIPHDCVEILKQDKQ